MVLFFLVTMSNSFRIWLIRAIGEDEYFALLVNAAGKAKLKSSLILNFVPGMCMTFLGLSMLVFFPDPDKSLGFWFASGVLTYAFILTIYFPKNFMRLRKLALSNKSS